MSNSLILLTFFFDLSAAACAAFGSYNFTCIQRSSLEKEKKRVHHCAHHATNSSVLARNGTIAYVPHVSIVIHVLLRRFLSVSRVIPRKRRYSNVVTAIGLFVRLHMDHGIGTIVLFAFSLAMLMTSGQGIG